MMKEYRTIDHRDTAEFIEKKSRFIGHIAPVSTEEDAAAFIQSIKSKYWDATHNVSAFILREGQIKRYSDDGEPRGTAGVPVLDVLEKERLVDCAVVVTRYFGGTLLGAGGLVRAYSHGCKIAIDAGKVVRMTPCINSSVICDYSFYERLIKLCGQFQAVVDHTAFSDQVHLEFHVQSNQFLSMNEELVDLSNGKYQLISQKESFQKMSL